MSKQPHHVENDAGRAAAGFVGKARDCVARAVAIASGRPYDEVYKRLADAMKWIETIMPMVGHPSTPQARAGKSHEYCRRMILVPSARYALGFARSTATESLNGGVGHLGHRNGTFGTSVIVPCHGRPPSNAVKAAGRSRSPPHHWSYFGSTPSTLMSRAAGACLSIHSLPPPL